MRKLIFILLLINTLFLTPAQAVSVDKETAARVGTNFLNERFGNTELNYNRIITFSQPYEFYSNGQRLYYVFNVEGGGFVIVSASDCVVPVIAYSFEGKFDNDKTPCNFGAWMEHYRRQITEAIQSKRTVPEYITNEWNRLKDLRFKPRPFNRTASIEPMLTSDWNQDYPYNGSCPADAAGPGGHAYAGCVATAMGQLMYFYRFPQHGTGSYSYQHPVYGTISANFDTTTYQWNGMTNSIGSANLPIATLLYHLGVSVDMDYGPDGSGMWNHKAAYALRTYFGYGPETQYIFRDSTNLNWDSVLISNLNAGKPLYYAGWEGVGSTSGHAFVCDGYQDTAYFHFNWGWSGSYNGYFYLNQLNPGGSNFNFAQEVIKDIFPDTINSTYPSNCQGQQVLHYITGSIDDGSGYFNYTGNQDCSWLIAPQDFEIDSITSITISFSKFDTESGADNVTIYAGETTSAPVLGNFSGDQIPPTLTAPGNKMLVTFHSNATVNKSGWLASWNCQMPVYCNGTTVITDPFGTFGDGSGDKHYNNNTLCKWKIQPPGASSLTLSFNSFDTEAGNDNLKIYDPSTQQLLATCSGGQIPQPVTSASGKMMLIFISNESTTGQGWEASYTVGNVGQKNEGPSLFSALYPNPCYGITNFAVNLPSPQQLKAEILDTKGTIRQLLNFNGNTGQNTFSIDLSSNEQGVYIVHFTGSNINIYRQVIIINQP